MLSHLMRIAIVGATGAVGREMLKVLERRKFPLSSLRCFSSSRSFGTSVLFERGEIPLEILSMQAICDIDIALFSAGSAVAREWAPRFASQGAVVIDNSSAFRMDPDIPLVIPEINSHRLLACPKIISSPNCTTTIMLMALAPVHRRFPIKRIVGATYQAASGGGSMLIEDLLGETSACLEGTPYERKSSPYPYAFNLFPHNSPMTSSGYVEEELKLLYETRKILEEPQIQITVTCVRVPVLRAHSIALNIEFYERVELETVTDILKHAPGVLLMEDRSQNRFPMPSDASHHDAILCGRVRRDHSHPNAIELWVVGDQLLKGAALNAVQIAELIPFRDKKSGLAHQKT